MEGGRELHYEFYIGMAWKEAHITALLGSFLVYLLFAFLLCWLVIYLLNFLFFQFFPQCANAYFDIWSYIKWDYKVFYLYIMEQRSQKNECACALSSCCNKRFLSNITWGEKSLLDLIHYSASARGNKAGAWGKTHRGT